MTGQASTTAVAFAAAGGAAAVVGGPLMQVFNEMALVMAITGAAGGVCRSMALHQPFKDVFGSAIFGALLAFGVGLMAPKIVEKVIGIEIGPDTTSVPMLASSGFLLALGQDYIRNFLWRWFIRSRGGRA